MKRVYNLIIIWNVNKKIKNGLMKLVKVYNLIIIWNVNGYYRMARLSNRLGL